MMTAEMMLVTILMNSNDRRLDFQLTYLNCAASNTMVGHSMELLANLVNRMVKMGFCTINPNAKVNGKLAACMGHSMIVKQLVAE